jgi:hypothetical protein
MLAEGALVLYFWRNGGDTLKHGGPTTSTKGWRRESRVNAARMAIGRIKKRQRVHGIGGGPTFLTT